MGLTVNEMKQLSVVLLTLVSIIIYIAATPAGIHNHGNYCFLSSSLQGLFYLRSFRSAIYDTVQNDSALTQIEKSVAEGLAEVFGMLELKETNTVNITPSFYDPLYKKLNLGYRAMDDPNNVLETILDRLPILSTLFKVGQRTVLDYTLVGKDPATFDTAVDFMQVEIQRALRTDIAHIPYNETETVNGIDYKLASSIHFRGAHYYIYACTDPATDTWHYISDHSVTPSTRAYALTQAPNAQTLFYVRKDLWDSWVADAMVGKSDIPPSIRARINARKSNNITSNTTSTTNSSSYSTGSNSSTSTSSSGSGSGNTSTSSTNSSTDTASGSVGASKSSTSSTVSGSSNNKTRIGTKKIVIITIASIGAIGIGILAFVFVRRML